MKQKNIFATALTLGAILLSGIFSATNALAGDIMVKDAWSRASASMSGAGAAFFTINNMGSNEDKILSVSSNIAKKTELHTHIMDGDIMKMRRVDFVPAPVGTSELKPGGNHVMFMGLKNKLVEGTTFPITLNFEKAGPVHVTVTVLSPAAKGVMDGNMKNMGHDNMNKGHGNMK